MRKNTALVLSARRLQRCRSACTASKTGVEGRNIQLQLTERFKIFSLRFTGKAASGRKSAISARLSALRGRGLAKAGSCLAAGKTYPL